MDIFVMKGEKGRILITTSIAPIKAYLSVPIKKKEWTKVSLIDDLKPYKKEVTE